MNSPWKLLSLILALTPLGVHGTPMTEFQVVRAYLLLGQSNMEGFACINELATVDPSLTGPQPNVLISSRTDCNGGLPGPAWETLEAGANTNLCYPGYFGPEVSLGTALRDHYGEPIYLVKYGVGNTFLTSPAQNAAVPANFSWNTDGGLLFSSMLDHLAAAQAALPANHGLQLEGIFWVQGTHDSGNSINATLYEANLNDFITTLRAALVAGGYTLNPELPVILSHVPEYLTSIYGPRFFDTVRCAEQRMPCTIPEVGIYDPMEAKANTQDTCGLGDIIHMDSQSQIDHGRGLFQAYLDRSCPALSIEDCTLLDRIGGGSTQLTLNSPSHPGHQAWLLGSEMGTSPGISVGIGTIPLVYGPYFEDTLSPNPTYLPPGPITLDASGKATVTLTVPNCDLLPFGDRVHHAFVVQETDGTLVEISNPVSLRWHPISTTFCWIPPQ